MNHPSQLELLAYAARTVDDRQGAVIAGHLAACDQCRAVCRAMTAVEGALHRLQPERPSRGFTRSVLSRIGVREAAPLWWLFLRNFAPVLAAGILAVVVLALGAGGEGTPGTSVGKSLFDAAMVRESVMGAVDAFAAWTAGVASKYVTVRVGDDGMNFAFFLVCLFAGIGALDRFLLQPILRRRR